MPSAEVVSIGTELLLGDIVDTHAATLGSVFARHGITHRRRGTVGDNIERATQVIGEALQRADIVVTVGGLGPTGDDITRQAVAAALDEPLVADDDALAKLREYVNVRGRRWSDLLAKQALRPMGATLIENTVGSAPGLRWINHGKALFSLPGPKEEFVSMLPMLESYLATLEAGVIVSRTLRVVGVPESILEDKLSDLMASDDPTVSPYAKQWEVHLRISAHAKEAATAVESIEKVDAEIRRRIGNAVYGVDEQDLQTAVVDLLRQRGSTLSVAESCTGGMLGERITSVPGASEVFVGGFITYSNAMKVTELGVSQTDLETHGAVSESVARQMAEGAKHAAGSDYALGITGIAGPGGESDDKPVGLVYIACSSPQSTQVSRHIFPGNRELVRYRATQVALDTLRRELLK
jgi:nicotinamide-nucleotide amidase